MVVSTLEKPVLATGETQDKPKDLSASGAGLEGKKESTEAKPERTYTESEYKRAVGTAGQKLKADLDAVTAERDTLRGQLATITEEITEAKASIEDLTKQIDVEAGEDPERKGLIKLRKDKEAELKALKVERAAVAETAKENIKFKRDQLVYAVADEYGTDYDRFMANADRLKANDRESLVAVAETMGLKLKVEVESEIEPHIPASGKTSGGGIDLDALSPREKIEKGLEQKKKK